MIINNNPNTKNLYKSSFKAHSRVEQRDFTQEKFLETQNNPER